MASPSIKIVLITGTATGVGFTTALTFAGVPGKKYKVYATMRNMKTRKDELESAAGSMLNNTLFIRELEVGNEKSMVECVESILKEEKRIDLLINNAAIVHGGLFEQIDLGKDGTKHFQVNYFGPLRLMQLVIPSMKERKSGRILNISSIGTLLPCPFTDLYLHPKWALEGATECVAVTLRPFNVWASVVQLGAVMTQRAVQVQAAFDQYKDAFLKPPYIKNETDQEIFAKHAKNSMSLFTHETCQTPEEVAKFLITVAEEEKPVLYYQSSEFARKLAAAKLVDPTGEKGAQLYEAGVLSIA